MTSRNEKSTILGSWFAGVAKIAILLVLLMAVAAIVFGLWNSQRGFFLSGLGSLIFIVLLCYADAGRFKGAQPSQEDIPPLGLAKGSVRAILAFSLIAGFGLYIYYATVIKGNVNDKIFAALSSIISAVVGFYFGARSNPPAGVAAGIAALTATGIDPNRERLGAMVEISNLAGTNFQPGATVSLKLGDNYILGKYVNVVHSSKITCSFDLSQTSQIGKWNVVVTNPDGQKGILAEGFEIMPITSP